MVLPKQKISKTAIVPLLVLSLLVIKSLVSTVTLYIIKFLASGLVTPGIENFKGYTFNYFSITKIFKCHVS